MLYGMFCVSHALAGQGGLSEGTDLWGWYVVVSPVRRVLFTALKTGVKEGTGRGTGQGGRGRRCTT